MGVYRSLTKDFSDDVKWLRKELIKKVLDSCDYLESYETFNFFTTDLLDLDNENILLSVKSNLTNKS